MEMENISHEVKQENMLIRQIETYEIEICFRNGKVNNNFSNLNFAIIFF